MDQGDDPPASRSAIEPAGEPPEAAAIYERVVRGELGPRFPLATYRVQLNREFTFDEARAKIDYLHALGVSDLYASPFFRARPGSMHGYDLTDHNALNPEIGSADAFGRLHARIVARGMGLLLDFVPNHMGIGTSDNAWWTDVLENGPSSVHAAFFDIDWKPLKTELASKVLLPVLGDHYGRVLEKGELRLAFEGGGFFVSYWATRLPLNPSTYPMILGRVTASLAAALGEEHEAVLELHSILTGLGHLPPQTVTARPKTIERAREKEALKRRLARLVTDAPRVADALEAELRVMNGVPGEPRSFDALDALLEDQCYRLSFWRVAAEEINYRRFFDINDLGAIRVEIPAVFAEAHRLLLQLVSEGKVTGLRIDHPDGLWDPVSYFARLQRSVFLDRCERELQGWGGVEAAAIQSALMRRFDRESAHGGQGGPESAPPRPLYIVVEKILSRGEELPQTFAVHGTTGYDFATLASGIFVDRAAERAMTATYERFIGRSVEFVALMYEKKKLVLLSSLASELNVLAHALNRLSERDRRTRDFTLGTLTAALREVIACFPVYRTYVREQTHAIAPRDRAAVGVAIRLARRQTPLVDASVFEFLRSILLLDVPESASDDDRASFRDFVMRFQQLTGPVMAKGLEDTSFYIYNRLISLNEVGGEPERFGVDVGEFHQANEDRLRRFPYSLLATSTHDTKRSEDVRARISVLSELPEQWDRVVNELAAATAPLEVDLDGVRAPDRNEQYLLYQTLMGTWPITATAAGGAEPGTPGGVGPSSTEYVERIVAYMSKATKEAKVNTSWINADPEYDAAVETFVRGVLGSAAFWAAFEPMARVVAYHGMWGALSQALLKLASPGVPDIYQGTELWDDSLVDPDNRRRVDFTVRAKKLVEIRARKSEGAPFARELCARAGDGSVKLFVTHVALDARRSSPGLFGAESSYTALHAVGAKRDHVVAFSRSAGRVGDLPAWRRAGVELVVVAPRLSAKLAGGRLLAPIGPIWGDTQLPVREGRYTNLFTGQVLSAADDAPGGAALPLEQVLRDFPVALLAR